MLLAQSGGKPPIVVNDIQVSYFNINDTDGKYTVTYADGVKEQLLQNPLVKSNFETFDQMRKNVEATLSKFVHNRDAQAIADAVLQCVNTTVNFWKNNYAL